MPITQDRMIALFEAADAVRASDKERRLRADFVMSDGRLAHARESQSVDEIRRNYESVVSDLYNAIHDYFDVTVGVIEVLTRESERFSPAQRQRNLETRNAVRASRLRTKSENYGNERTLFNPTGAHDPMRIGDASPPESAQPMAQTGEDVVIENGVKYMVLDDGSRIRVLE